MSSQIYVKQYGAKRSGTNYTRWLIEHNFDIHALTNVLGWKHGPHPTEVNWNATNWVDPGKRNAAAIRRQFLDLVTDDIRRAVASGKVRYLITTKNPYAWFISLKRHDGSRLAEAIMTWNALHANWLNLVDDNELAMIVRYEDLLLDFQETMGDIKDRLRLPVTEEPFVNVRKKMGKVSDNKPPVTTSHQFNRGYYVNREYMRDLKPRQIARINELLDASVMRRLGYERCQ